MKGPLIYYEIQNMYGADLSDSKSAKDLRSQILEDIDLGFNVEVDFKDINKFSNNWFKNALGIIIKDKGSEFFNNHIIITNANNSIKRELQKYN